MWGKVNLCVALYSHIMTSVAQYMLCDVFFTAQMSEKVRNGQKGEKITEGVERVYLRR